MSCGVDKVVVVKVGEAVVEEWMKNGWVRKWVRKVYG